MFKTVTDVVALIAAMSQSDDPKLGAHARGLMGPRTRGSTTRSGLEALPGDRVVTEITSELPDTVKTAGCRYFRVYAGDIEPCLGAVAYDHAVMLFGRDAIKERVGPHGPELFIDQEGFTPRPCSYCVVIVGPAGEYGFKDGVVWTWHPGMPLARHVEGQKPTDHTGVKLHNG